MSPNLAHVKDYRPESTRMVQQLADAQAYVKTLTTEIEDLQGQVTMLITETNEQCDVIYDLQHKLSGAPA